MIEVPAALRRNHEEIGEVDDAWTTGLPALAESFLERWDLTLDGPPMHGYVSLVLPVVRADGVRAALKLQPATEENATEAPACAAGTATASSACSTTIQRRARCCWNASTARSRWLR
ncbi:hypothetical protein OIE66_41385 [Nonomuraea sp. NBC_01738]|nr:hypothetical protein OIE66_41385 [Nonomuraea sp. NBC_01738]